MCKAHVSGSLFYALKLAEVNPQPNLYTVQKPGFRVSNKFHFKQEAGDIRGAFQPDLVGKLSAPGQDQETQSHGTA